MADERKITIDLLSRIHVGEEEEEKEALGSKVMKFNKFVSSNAVDMVKDFARDSYSTYNSMTGNYLTQNVFNSIESGVSIGGNIIQNGIRGAKMAGPVGAIIGVAIGAVKTVIDTRMKYREAEIKLTETNMEIGFNSTRLGLIDGGRGTLN